MTSQEDANLREELAQMKKRVEKLEFENQNQKDEIRDLNLKVGTYDFYIYSVNNDIYTLTSQATQDAPFKSIGQEVRLRYLEKHRQRLNRPIGFLGRERIKRGDRAAHRGRPVPDALLCLTGVITDREVYQDLYGVSAEIVKECRDVPEVIEVTGFRGSLKSEGWLTEEFEGNFKQLLGMAKKYRSPAELRKAFGEDGGLQRLQGALQVEFDRVWAANRR